MDDKFFLLVCFANFNFKPINLELRYSQSHNTYQLFRFHHSADEFATDMDSFLVHFGKYLLRGFSSICLSQLRTVHIWGP